MTIRLRYAVGRRAIYRGMGVPSGSGPASVTSEYALRVPHK